MAGNAPRLAVAGSMTQSSNAFEYGWAGVPKRDRVLLDSTNRPAYMTLTLSQSSSTIPRLWVIITNALPRSSQILARRSRTCACVVTSKAVVGSSAMTTAGSLAMAMAMSTRCLIPPEYWWG